MQCLGFEEWFAMVSAIRLSATDVARLREWISGIADPAQCLALIERMAQDRPCPHCRHPRRHRCGEANGLQRFRCLGCRRTTSFRWRHRFVPGAARERPTTLSTIVEAGETYRLESQKGSRTLTRPARQRGGVARRRGINREHDCLLVARDRRGHTLDFHTGRGPLTARQLHECLGSALSADVLLVSDAAAVYRTFAAQAHITHEVVNVRTGVRARGAIHTQNVNAWHSRFKSWLVRFRGVASRYLINYSGWLRILDARRLTMPSQLLCAACRLG
jgi:hypothetical protein